MNGEIPVIKWLVLWVFKDGSVLDAQEVKRPLLKSDYKCKIDSLRKKLLRMTRQSFIQLVKDRSLAETLSQQMMDNLGSSMDCYIFQ